jgi:hypothetical protein
MTVTVLWVNPAGATIDLANGALVGEVNWDAIASDLYHLGGTVGYIGARAQHSVDQSIANNTATALALNTDVIDVDPGGELHSVSSNTSRITVRTAGVYHIAAMATFANNNTGLRALSIRLNGATFIGAKNQAAVNGDVTQVAVYTAYALNPTDYVEAIATQTSGGALNVQSAGGYSPVLTCFKS